MIQEHRMSLRNNNALAIAVNQGIASALLKDLLTGAKVMTNAGVPSDVIKRVLLQPTHDRRNSDWR